LLEQDHIRTTLVPVAGYTDLSEANAAHVVDREEVSNERDGGAGTNRGSELGWPWLRSSCSQTEIRLVHTLVALFFFSFGSLADTRNPNSVSSERLSP
jgi:hypothetical protein